LFDRKEVHGVELVKGSDLERALALLVTIRWSVENGGQRKLDCD
jgi:hypothetical protein